MKLRSIKEIRSLAGKTVLVRVDFNVDIKNGRVSEKFRLKQAVETVKYLLKHDCRVIVMAHLGRPGGKLNHDYSLAPLVKEWRQLISPFGVKFYPGKIDAGLVGRVSADKSRLIMLDNLRFNADEEKNDRKFAEMLASMVDFYVNEAFSVSHREAASVVAITKLLPSYAGLNLMDEVNFLSRAADPKKPAMALIGGIKIGSKFGVIDTFVKKYDVVAVGGGIANTFFYAQGCSVGKSVVDKKCLGKIKKLSKKKILLPLDVIVTDVKTKTKKRYHKLSWGKDICEPDEMIADVGPETIQMITKILAGKKSIVWSGVFGDTSIPEFKKGSKQIMTAVADQVKKKNVVGVIGGGSMIDLVFEMKKNTSLDFISTGGGAMLEFLEQKTLVGLKSLIKK